MRWGRLRWYKHVMRRDQEYVERKEEKREAKKKISRCSEGRYGESWCEGEGH